MASYTYITLDDPLATYPFSLSTSPTGINDDGQIVGGYIDQNGSTVDFLYSAGTYTTLSLPYWPSVESTYVWGINNSGQLIGQYNDWSGLPHSFVTAPGGLTEINDPLSVSHAYNGTWPGQYSTFAEGINDAGDIVGYYYNDTGSHGFLHTGSDYATGYATIDDPFSFHSTTTGNAGTIARGINNADQIVGTYYDSGGASHGFLYINGTYTTIDDGNNTSLIGINNVGQIVGKSDNGYFLDSNGSFSPLNGIPGTVTGIDDAGQIVGYYFNSTGTHGFLATPVYQPPVIDTTNSVLAGIVNKVAYAPASSTPDAAQGTIAFTDGDLATTTATVTGQSIVFTNAQGTVETIPTSVNVTSLESAFQIGAVSSGNEGSVNWGYSIANSELSWLGVGETLTLASTVQVNDGQGDTTSQNVTVTINGADDSPVIIAAQSVVSGITSKVVIGGAVEDVASGIIAFSDPVLSDSPIATVISQSVTAHDSSGNVIALTPTQIADLESAFAIMPVPGNTNSGTIEWGYALLDQAASFLTAGESAIITSTVQLDDQHGGMVTQDVAVTINSALAPYVVPVLTVHNISVAENAPVAASSFIALSNPSGDDITQYTLIDTGSNGHFTVNGVSEPDGQAFNVSSLSGVQYVGGTSSGSDTLEVQFHDATTNSESSFSTVTATTTAPPPSNTTTIPAVAVEAIMYGVTGTAAEITSLVTDFLPAQVAYANQMGLDPQVFACLETALVFAFGNENGSHAFANNFGPSNTAMPDTAAGDAAFAAEAATAIFGSAQTANTANALLGYVHFLEGFFNANGIVGVPNATADQIDLAARAGAWGEGIAIALENSLGALPGQVTNFVNDITQGTAIYGAPLTSQPGGGGSLATYVATAENDVENGMLVNLNSTNSTVVTNIVTDLLMKFGTASTAQQLISGGYINPAGYTGADMNQCAVLVQALDPSVGRTGPNIGATEWTNGEQVDLGGITTAAGFNNQGIKAGTPIATFANQAGQGVTSLVQGEGHYPLATDAVPEHSGIFLGYQTVNGVPGFFLLDQWYNQPSITPSNEPAEIRFIGFSTDHNAEYYYAINPVST